VSPLQNACRFDGRWYALRYFAQSAVASGSTATVAVIAEIVAGNAGIGNVMLVAGSNFNVPLVFAALFVVGAMGVGMYAIFDLVERRMTGWSVRGEKMMQHFGGG